MLSGMNVFGDASASGSIVSSIFEETEGGLHEKLLT
jgi:hypothetical protein